MYPLPRTGPSPRIATTRLRAPPQGCAKIHVDASVTKSEMRGPAVAVCRVESGLYLGNSSLFVQGIIDVATHEAMACGEAFVSG